MKKYYGITYFRLFSNKLGYFLFKKFFYKRGIHLFDEVLSDEHYLHCDACELIVYIEKIEQYKAPVV